MSERIDEKWLDNELRRVVDGTTPVFDAESWKQKHAREFEALLRRSEQPDQSGTRRTVRLVLRASMGKLAVAAAVIVAAGTLLVGRFGLGPGRPVMAPQSVDFQSPARIVSMIAFSAAFRRGGIDELDRQCDRALERLGPRPNGVSMQELLKDISGLERERTSI